MIDTLDCKEGGIILFVFLILYYHTNVNTTSS